MNPSLGDTRPLLEGWRSLLPLVRRAMEALVAIGSGVLLGRTLLSTEWMQAIAAVGLTAYALVLLADRQSGLLLWMLLAPYGGYIGLKLSLGSGIPDFDVTRLAIAIFTVLLIAQPLPRKEPSAGESIGLDPTRAYLHEISQPHRRLAGVSWPEVAILTFLLAMALSLASSWLSPVSGIQTLADYVGTPLLLYFLARRWLASAHGMDSAIAVVAFTVALLGVISIREQLTGLSLFSPVPEAWAYEVGIRRVLSLWASPASMGTALSVPLPFVLYGLLRARTPRSRLLLGLALGIELLGVLLVYVRGGWLAAVLGLLVAISLNPSARRVLAPSLAVIAMAGLLLTLTAIIDPNLLQTRLTSDQPITYRLEAQQAAWTLIQRSPWLGYGYDNFGREAVSQANWTSLYLQIRGEVPAPHNTYIWVITSGGLVALLPFLAIFATLAWRGRRLWREAKTPGKGSEQRGLVATLWATLLAYAVVIGTFDVFNAQYANMLFYFILGTLMGQLEQLSGAFQERSVPGASVLGQALP